MDYPQWIEHHQPSAKAPRLYSSDPNIKRTGSSRMGSLFSLAQWQELELQALIYKYMMAGASVPLELILPLKKSLFSPSPYYHCQHFYPSLLQTGYSGRYLFDPEPGRCRRTDGKKWRCSREVVAGQKYCERHVHRGRNRSRKHVEIPTSIASSGFKATLSALEEKKESHFTLSGQSPSFDILSFNQRSHGETTERCLPQGHCPSFGGPQQLRGERTDSRVLMKFFDDWPRSKQDRTTSNDNNSSSDISATHLSISIPENSTSDFSLKLSTGNANNVGLVSEGDPGERGGMQPALVSWSGWDNSGVPSLGGPLAEAFRSSTIVP